MLTVPKKIPIMPDEKQWIQMFCFNIVQSLYFEYFIMCCILINTIFLLIDNYDKSPMLDKVLDMTNLVFIPIFTLEMLLKMTAYGIKFYFYVNWNKLDFCIVIFSFMSLFEGLLASIKINMTVLRILRVARLLRVIKASEGLRQLLKTLYISISNMVTTAFLLILILFTYSIVGMSILDDVEFGDNINKDSNFKSFYLSMISLVRCCTRDNWSGYMHDSY